MVVRARILTLGIASKRAAALECAGAGFNMNLFEMFRAARLHARDLRRLKAVVLNTFQNGSWTDAHLVEIAVQFRKLGLSPDALKSVRREAYSYVARQVAATGCPTADDQARLDRVQHFFVIPDAEIRVPKGRFLRLRLLSEVRRGNLPSVHVANIVLAAGEIAYWSELAQLLEERVVSRRYFGASRGVSVKISRSMTYRAGSQRGHMVIKRAMVPISSGSLVITNTRMIFSGNQKSSNIRFNKLLETQFTGKILRCSEQSGKDHRVQITNADSVEIIAEILSQAIKRFVL